MSDKTDERFASALRAVLEEDLARLDARTVARLRAARRAALARVGQPSLQPAWWVPATVAAGVAAVAMLWLWPQPDTTSLVASSGDEEILILSGDRIELYRDLEFYRWLAANDRSG